MFIINNRTFFLALSSVLFAASIISVVTFGLPLGIDFTGGSQMELTYEGERPSVLALGDALTTGGIDDVALQPIGEKGMLVKRGSITEEERSAILAVASSEGTTPVVQKSFTSIGPSVGAELARKAIISVGIVLIAIICYIAYAFRNVSKPVSSWKYGFATIIALIHDITIPLGAFALLAHTQGAELDTLFIVAILTTLALSISDTIVVFDRVRENLKSAQGKSFNHVVGESLSQTFARSINTSVMVLVVVIALAILGPESTRLFATVLAIGMFFGTYSSIFLASPILTLMQGKKGQ